jgi:hypothetical protein
MPNISFETYMQVTKALLMQAGRLEYDVEHTDSEPMKEHYQKQLDELRAANDALKKEYHPEVNWDAK